MRKALSPVITTVLLVVISVALALSAATFITDTQGEVSDRLTESVQEDIDLEQVSCNGRTARFRISNSGSRSAEFGRADFRVYQDPTPNDSFTQEGISVEGQFTNANSEGLFNVTTPPGAVFRSGDRYTLELFFTASDYDMRGECIAGQRWWNLNWDHRRQIRVSGHSDGDIASVEMDTAGDNIYSCNDIRIVDNLEVKNHELKDPCGTSDTTIAFEVTKDSGNPTDYDTYIYYGNNLANDASVSGLSVDDTIDTSLMQEENRSDY